MHYNFETKAALDPSLMFLEVEGTFVDLCSAPEVEGADAVWSCGEMGFSTGIKKFMSVFGRKGPTGWMESLMDSGRATLKMI